MENRTEWLQSSKQMSEASSNSEPKTRSGFSDGNRRASAHRLLNLQQNSSALNRMSSSPTLITHSTPSTDIS